MAFGSYTEITVGANEVRKLIGENGAKLDRAVAEVSAVVSALTLLGNEYGPIVQAAADMLTADPSNPAKATAKADVDQLLADFSALQTRAAALDALVNPVP